MSEKQIKQQRHTCRHLSPGNHQGNYIIAIDYFFKAFKIMILRLGKNHPDTQIIQKNLKNIFGIYYPNKNFEQWLENKMKETN